MNSFSIGDAYGAGFGLIARRPLSVLMWGIVFTVLRVAPAALFFVFVGPDFLSGISKMISAAVAAHDPGNPTALFLPAIAKFQSVVAISWLVSLVAFGVINAAVYRAVIRPEDGGFFGMKLGMDEVWQGLLYLCLSIFIGIVVFVGLMAGALLVAIVFFIGEAVGSPLGGWIKAIGIFAVCVSTFVAIVWTCLRFSLAGPASFDQRGFQLFESWSITKGQSWPLLGLALLIFVTILVIEAIIGFVLLSGIVGLSLNDAMSPEAIEAFFAQPPDQWLLQATPFLVAMVLIGALLGGAIYTIIMAPFASAYRQLTSAPSAS